MRSPHLHLSTERELHQLEEQLGVSRQLPDPFYHNNFRDDFAAVFQSLDEATEQLNCSFASAASYEEEVSARELDIGQKTLDYRTDQVCEDSFELDPSTSGLGGTAAVNLKLQPDGDSDAHPFAVFNSRWGSGSDDTRLAGSPGSSSMEISDDDSEEDMAHLSSVLSDHALLRADGSASSPGGGDSMQASDDFHCWPLGVLAGGYVASQTNTAVGCSPAAMDALVLVVLCCLHSGLVGPYRCTKFFNHLYIIHHLWGQTREEQLNDSYYDSDCSSDSGTESAEQNPVGGVRRNPLFSMVGEVGSDFEALIPLRWKHQCPTDCPPAASPTLQEHPAKPADTLATSPEASSGPMQAGQAGAHHDAPFTLTSSRSPAQKPHTVPPASGRTQTGGIQASDEFGNGRPASMDSVPVGQVQSSGRWSSAVERLKSDRCQPLRSNLGPPSPSGPLQPGTASTPDLGITVHAGPCSPARH